MSAPDVNLDIKFIGGPELMACLREEVPRVAKNALRTGLFWGAKIVETAARADAPRHFGMKTITMGFSAGGAITRRKFYKNPRSAMSEKYGPLYKKIKARRGKGTANTVKAGVSFGTAFYGWFLERGTTKRYTKKTKSYRGIITARPFMVPALERNQAAIIAEVIKSTREALIKIKAKTRQAAL